MTRLIRWLEKRHYRRTTRWNAHHGRPAVTTRRTP